jgi:hypothetical protein
MSEKQDSSPDGQIRSDPQREIEQRISKLRKLARQGGWGLAVFVVISVLAIPNFNVVPPLPEKVRMMLGEAPRADFIGLALVVYVFSALTLTLARITQGTGIYRGWSHLFYITAFYIFYAFAGVMEDTFWAVFVSGLIILGLENFAIRTYCSEIIQEEMERLEGINESPESRDQGPEE